MPSKKVYLDATETNGCTSVFMKDTEIINAGTTIYSMPVKHKNAEYERYAKDYDIQFIFEDNMPLIDFYTIPQVDIFATDNQGGYLGTVGHMTDFESDAPICYIDKKRNCYLIADSGTEFMQKVASWNIALEEYDEVKFYASKEEAMLENEFIDINKFDKEI